MESRDKILNSIARNEKALSSLPDFVFGKAGVEPVKQFQEVLVSIGGRVMEVKSREEIEALALQIAGRGTVVSFIDNFSGVQETKQGEALEATEVAVLQGEFGVAENGAVWITEENLPHRALPFICQHLVLVVSKKEIVSDMHEAYNRIGDSKYGFGTFIAGPSKTADIEQSLVLGAHGPKTMLVCLLD